MNYSALNSTIEKEVEQAVALICNPEIAPEIRQLNLEILFKQIGTDIYNNVYLMNAFDYEILETIGAGIGDSYFGVAKAISDSISVGGKDRVKDFIESYLNNCTSKAQSDATFMAMDLGKKPTVTRTEKANCCKWCTAHQGTFIEPTREVFRRHLNCRATLRTFGWRTKNGLYGGKVDSKGWQFNPKSERKVKELSKEFAEVRSRR